MKKSTKKHIDWKRIGLTFIYLCLALACTWGLYALGNCVAGKLIDAPRQFHWKYVGYDFCLFWFSTLPKWFTGLAIALIPFALWGLYLLITKKVIHFYYHNGTKKK